MGVSSPPVAIVQYPECATADAFARDPGDEIYAKIMSEGSTNLNYCFAQVLLQLLENDYCPNCSFLNTPNHPDNQDMQLPS